MRKIFVSVLLLGIIFYLIENATPSSLIAGTIFGFVLAAVTDWPLRIVQSLFGKAL